MEITKGKIPKPIKAIIYGPEGIGKSTLASHCPDPVFIDTEGSTAHMDVARFPAPESWTMLLQEVAEVKKDPAICKTLVIDTADWAERLCIDHVLAVNKWASVESPGYGKGYVAVKEEFGKLLNLLTEVIDSGTNVVLTAHAIMRKFEQPDEMGAYDRWELKLSKHNSPLVKEWADMILFCNYKTLVVNVDNQGAQKGKNKAQGGRRVMYTQHHPCWDAKNRFGLPEELDMDFGAIAHVFVKDVKPVSNPVKSDPVRPSPAQSEQPAPAAGVTAPPPDEDPDVPAKSKEKETQSETKADPFPLYLSNPDNLPAELKQLMETDDISEWEIEQVVYARGYFPDGTPIEKMEQASPGFVKGWIIQFWPQVKELAMQIRKDEGIPFN